jgi:hypothetical protein
MPLAGCSHGAPKCKDWKTLLIELSAAIMSICSQSASTDVQGCCDEDLAAKMYSKAAAMAAPSSRQIPTGIPVCMMPHLARCGPRAILGSHRESSEGPPQALAGGGCLDAGLNCQALQLSAIRQLQASR